MLNMTPAAILPPLPPRGHGVSPPASRRASLPQLTPERDGEEAEGGGRRGAFYTIQKDCLISCHCRFHGLLSDGWEVLPEV